ncbi:MFS transporter [Cognatiyoonia sp. IB215446]|uniref:MFS transporter n=1 Tax=Cognatiyoonia sp. IB215446 TaxID=3097355 RepID=UPI002A1678EB|nr:MFS transporter [Cognatiyoonia sp. IB215446]MDX8349784.1 MFS transporter [Cognatiyoonia sp. IB215446]
MWQLVFHPVFGRLFAAQVVALLGTGLLTVALGLLAFDLAGAAAGAVLGTAYAIKMVAYVGLSPIAGAMVAKIPRRQVLIGADIVRAVVALSLPFITQVWQIYLAIFLLQVASATFTPTFQATIPDVLEDEDEYAKGLSLSRLAYDLENLLSPALAGLMLLLISYHWLFGGTVIGFLISALLIQATTLPMRRAGKDRPFSERLTRGTRIYLATPRLRGLLALTLPAAAASAFVIVNTVVVVRGFYAGSDRDVAIALAAFGAGSMLAALALPRLLQNRNDRPVMLTGAALLTMLMGLQTAVTPSWPLFLGLWTLMGLGYSATITPQGRLIRRSAHADDRPAVFTAQFALSHACWLVTYPLAGTLMTQYGAQVTFAALGVIGLIGVALAWRLWPAGDPVIVAHSHPDLPDDHPHLKGGGHSHAHPLIIDDEHHAWPTNG